MGASLDMNGNRILNLPAPTNPTDVVRYQDLLAAEVPATIFVGSVNDYATVSTAASQVPAGTQWVRTAGYAAAGDGGGAVYLPVSGSTPGGFQASAGSQWYQLAFPYSANAKCYGAKGDNTTNDTAALQLWASVPTALPGFSGPGGYLYLPPGIYLVRSNIHIGGSNITAEFQGKIFADPANFTPAADETTQSGFVLSISSNNSAFSGITTDGGVSGNLCVANGVLNTGFHNQFFNTSAFHYKFAGVSHNVEDPGSYYDGIEAVQWGTGDPQFYSSFYPLSDSRNLFTATGLYINGSDSDFTNIDTHLNAINIRIGPASNNNKINKAHPWNGTFYNSGNTGTLLGPAADPINIWLDPGSSGNQFSELYLDNGRVMDYSNAGGNYFSSGQVVQTNNVYASPPAVAGVGYGSAFTDACLIHIFQTGATNAPFRQNINLVNSFLPAQNTPLSASPTRLFDFFQAEQTATITAVTGPSAISGAGFVDYTIATSSFTAPYQVPQQFAYFTAAGVAVSGYNGQFQVATVTVSGGNSILTVANTTTGATSVTGATLQATWLGSYSILASREGTYTMQNFRLTPGDLIVQGRTDTSIPFQDIIKPSGNILTRYYIGDVASTGSWTFGTNGIFLFHTAGLQVITQSPGTGGIVSVGAGSTDDLAIVATGSGPGYLRLQATRMLDFASLTSFVPHTNNSVNLGGASNLWAGIFTTNISSTNALVVTSDITKKETRSETVPGAEFWDALSEFSFEWKDDDNHVLHYGHSAQDVAKLLEASGITSHAMHVTDENGLQGLARDEWWAIASKTFKQLNERIKALETRLGNV